MHIGGGDLFDFDGVRKHMLPLIRLLSRGTANTLTKETISEDITETRHVASSASPTHVHVPEEVVDLLATIGTGSFGAVHLGSRRRRGVGAIGDSRGDPATLCAVKSLSKRIVMRENCMGQVRTEWKVLSELRHCFLCRGFYAFQTEKYLHFVEELGCSDLYSQLRARGSLPAGAVRFYAAEILLALEHLHLHGIVMRDLKPENVILDERGHVRLVDFGLAVELSKKKHGRATTLCGSLGYMAPEILERSGGGYAYAADVWGWGCLIYELLTGNTPFSGAAAAKADVPSAAESDDREDEAARQRHLERLRAPVNYPWFMNWHAKDLLKQVLVRDPELRLPWNAAKGHAFFDEVDWEQLAAMEAPPPIVPEPEDRCSAAWMRAHPARLPRMYRSSFDMRVPEGVSPAELFVPGFAVYDEGSVCVYRSPERSLPGSPATSMLSLDGSAHQGRSSSSGSAFGAFGGGNSGNNSVGLDLSAHGTTVAAFLA